MDSGIWSTKDVLETAVGHKKQNVLHSGSLSNKSKWGEGGERSKESKRMHYLSGWDSRQCFIVASTFGKFKHKSSEVRRPHLLRSFWLTVYQEQHENQGLSWQMSLTQRITQKVSSSNTCLIAKWISVGV